MSVPHTLTRAARLRAADCDLDDFVALVEQTTDLADFPLAAEVVDRVLVYDAERLRSEQSREDGADTVAAELVRALTDGPGVVAIRGAFTDTDVVDRATAAFDAMIADEKAAGGAKGDHFAKAGANDRVWNALEKLALRDPETFVDYYANDVIALVSKAWLGPGYQVTSQVNVVRPGGQAQDPHRDYHLGFLENDVVEQYPTHVHLLSPVLTLQGAVAHSDMPVESGPTMYLPYSHQYAPGYLAWRLPELPCVLRRALRPAAAGEGRRRLLQPRALPRRRHQRLGGRPAGREPAAGLVGVRPGDGDGGPRPRAPGGLPRAPEPQGRRGAGGVARPCAGGRRRGLPLPHQPRPRPARGRHDAAGAGRARRGGAGVGDAGRGARRGARPVRRTARHLVTAARLLDDEVVLVTGSVIDWDQQVARGSD